MTTRIVYGLGALAAVAVLITISLMTGGSGGGPGSPDNSSLSQNGQIDSRKTSQDKIELSPHKALYNIDLVATKSGAQIVNVSGEMYYELTLTCDAWITDHRFNLRYEYIDSPAVDVKSHFSTYERFDGSDFNFTATRKRGGVVYEELQGHGFVNDKGIGSVTYKQPDGLTFELPETSRFPMRHTVDLLETAYDDRKFFQSNVFDGSDDEGPVSINAFIGEAVNALSYQDFPDKVDVTMINGPARKIRLAFFPLDDQEASSDYEMEMILHDNGVVSDMLVEYQTFSVTQELLALEKLPLPDCGQ